jgi:hypothetical protein
MENGNCLQVRSDELIIIQFMKKYSMKAILMFNLYFISSLSLKWDYYPKSNGKQSNVLPKYGIVMGGSSDLFHMKNSYANYTTCIAQIYARRFNYAIYIEKNLELISSRQYDGCNMIAWNKIKLIQNYIKDVDYLIWIDLDGFILRYNTSLDFFIKNKIINQSDCLPSIHDTLGYAIKHYNDSNLPGASEQPFLWLSEDINPNYAVNVNTAVMVLRRCKQTDLFLHKVWDIGTDINAFKKHDIAWKDKIKCQGYYGWPWEQGAIWDILSDSLDTSYLQGTCILPNQGNKGLNSVTSNIFDSFHLKRYGKPFILHHYNQIENLFRLFIKRKYINFKQIYNICNMNFF